MEEEHIKEGRGRSEKRREALALSKFVARLFEAPDAMVAALPLEEELLAELQRLRLTKGRGSRKRAIKTFAGRLRGDEEARESLLGAMAQIDGAHGRDTANHKDLELLRERLCSTEEHDAAMQEVAAGYPGVDRRALLRLVKSVQRGRDKRAFREIFRRLREAREAQAESPSA